MTFNGSNTKPGHCCAILVALSFLLFLNNPAHAMPVCKDVDTNKFSYEEIQKFLRTVPKESLVTQEVDGVRATIPAAYLGYRPYPWQIGCVKTRDEGFHMVFWQPTRIGGGVSANHFRDPPPSANEKFVISIFYMKPTLPLRVGDVRVMIERGKKFHASFRGLPPPSEAPAGMTRYPVPHGDFYLVYQDEHAGFRADCSAPRPGFFDLCDGKAFYGGWTFSFQLPRTALDDWRTNFAAVVELMNSWTHTRPPAL